MSGTVSFTELDGQHVELLPARTVLSIFIQGSGGKGGSGDNQPFAPNPLALLGLNGTNNGVQGTDADGNTG